MDVFEDLFSDSDSEIVEFLEWKPRPYIIKERKHRFEEFDDVDFVRRFRLKKETVLYVLSLIEDQIETVTDRNYSVRPIDQILIALRFYATGNMILSVADFLNVSKSTASKIIKKVSNALAKLISQFIKMPTIPEDILNAKESFFDKAHCQRIIGSLDCTHVRIQSPGGDNAEVFRNRKGYYSIDVQTIASVDLKILDIVARWPGSAHDQTIFDNSAIKKRFERNEFGNSLLVADSGYANTFHVITPLLETKNEVEELYNESVIRTRNPVERQYGAAFGNADSQF